MKIFKYKIEPGQGPIKMPQGSEILCLQTQNEEPHIWVKVDEDATLWEYREFVIIGTGWKFSEEDEKGKYVGTYQEENGRLVFHVFEVEVETPPQ